jgi:starch-binding outer membrane protein, SusD/RagB family
MYKIKSNFLTWVVVLLASGSLLSGCTKQLNQQPQATASQQAVFTSVQGLSLYTQSFYSIYNSTTSPWGQLPGENIYKTDAQLSDFGAMMSVPTYLTAGAYTSQTTPESMWNWYPLRNINYFLQNIPTAPIPGILATDIANYQAIGKFFRAYFYYTMVQTYGNLPWINTALSPTDSTLYGPRISRTIIMDSVVADLQYAAANLQTQTDPDLTYINKWTAYGLLSRAALFEGTFEKYQNTTGGTPTFFLQAAETAAQAVMASGQFSLNTTGGTGFEGAYRNLFISINGPVVPETMWGVSYSTAQNVFNDANWYYTSATYGDRFSFTRRFINTYLNADGTPFTSVPGYDTMSFMHEMQNRDARLYQTIRTPGYTRTNVGVTVAAPPVFNYTYTGYQPIKWVEQDESLDGGALGTSYTPMMRYAEILLNYAEAKEELQNGSLTASDWTNTVGALRARGGITGGNTVLPTTLDPYMVANYYPAVTDPVIMEIRRERGIELCLEGFRFADLARWNAGNLMNSVGPNGQPNVWNGIYIPSLNTRYDLNGDGVLDVCFYQATQPTKAVADSDVTFINVTPTISSGTNPQILANGTSGEINWLNNLTKTFQPYMYIYPIPFQEIELNPNLGQNPGWN